MNENGNIWARKGARRAPGTGTGTTNFVDISKEEEKGEEGGGGLDTHIRVDCNRKCMGSGVRVTPLLRQQR